MKQKSKYKQNVKRLIIQLSFCHCSSQSRGNVTESGTLCPTVLGSNLGPSMLSGTKQYKFLEIYLVKKLYWWWWVCMQAKIDTVRNSGYLNSPMSKIKHLLFATTIDIKLDLENDNIFRVPVLCVWEQERATASVERSVLHLQSGQDLPPSQPGQQRPAQICWSLRHSDWVQQGRLYIVSCPCSLHHREGFI